MTASPEPRLRFLIGGVQKAGTSALAHYLARHPQLCLPRQKELHLFDAPDFDDTAGAAALDARIAEAFPPAATDALHGDATPFSLLHPRVVARVARYNPRMRWIVLLRDPAERALSHYHMERARGGERWPLWPALLLERWRLRGHRDDFARGSVLRRHSYLLRGDYAAQLDVLYAHFPRTQVLLLQSAELRRDPAACVARACIFLGVAAPAAEAEYPPVFSGQYPPPSTATRLLLHWLLRGPRRALQARHGIAFPR